MSFPSVDLPGVRRVALITADPSYPLHDVDREVTAEALDRAGLEHVLVPWTAEVDWAGFDMAVLRSTWDYTTQVEDFLVTLAQVDQLTTLVNPLDVVRWNVDKRYLGELTQAGFAVTPGAYVSPGDDPAAVIRSTRSPLVVKPVVSAGAKNTRRHDHHESAEVHARRLLEAGVTIMVQPYLADVDTQGETGLVFLAGHYSHAFRKAPILAGADGHPTTVADVLVERITPRQATHEQIALGQEVVDWLGERFGTLLYARVDLLPTAQGPVVLEVELVEPNLFFRTAPGAADAFARHLAVWPSLA